MVRRIGFGDGEKKERARQYGARAERAEREEPTFSSSGIPNSIAPTPQASARPEQESDGKKMPRGSRVALTIFLAVWLSFWTFGMLMAASLVSEAPGGADLFLIVWLIAAAVAWLFVARTIYRLLTGRPVKLGKGRRSPFR